MQEVFKLSIEALTRQNFLFLNEQGVVISTPTLVKMYILKYVKYLFIIIKLNSYIKASTQACRFIVHTVLGFCDRQVLYVATGAIGKLQELVKGN